MKTKKSNSKKRSLLLFILAFTLIFSGSHLFTTTESTSATSYCVTDRCKEAEAAEKEATEKANNAAAAANTLNGEIERLKQEIKLYEARIIANRAKAADLKAEIEFNTAKLDLQRTALAKMLADVHFEGETDAIMILASSSSLSDFAEKQSRVETAKTQISISVQTIKALKEDLEKQKKEIDRIIADEELQQKAIEETKRREEELVRQYKSNAKAYSSAAAAARKVKENEIAEEIRRLNSSGVVGDGSNTYPKRNACPRDNLQYGFYGGYVCQCVSYTGWKVYERYGYRISAWGDAKNWPNSARRLGFRVDHNPEAGSVAISTGGAYGHAMWVESINRNGTINVSEYNNAYSSASGKPGDFGYRIGVSTSGLWFIHF